MTRALEWLVCLALAGCGGSGEVGEAPAAHAPELRDVVEQALARLAAQIDALEPPPSGVPADLAERLDGLFETVHGSHAATRGLALEELRGLGDAVVPGLRARLEQRTLDEGRRRTAAELLAVLDTPAAAAALLDVLEGSRLALEREEWLYATCARLLGQTNQTWVAPRLVSCLKYETDHATVIEIADSLAGMGLLSGVDALGVVARDGVDARVRARAASVLERLRVELGCRDASELAALWNEGPSERLPPGPSGPRYEREVWRQIGALAEWQLRGVDDARFTLAHLRELAAALLGQALLDRDVYVRMHSAQCLARMGPRARSAAPALEAALDDPSVPVAAAAAEALGSLGSEASALALRACLGADRPLDLRIAAGRALDQVSSAAPPGN